MKSTQLFIALFWIFTAFNVFAQQEIGTMRNYIAKGDAESLSEFFNESVEISIPGSSDIYAQAQAKMIIKNFFSNNQPYGFEIVHQGEKNNTLFVIGTLRTNKGEFRMHLLIKIENNNYIIHQLRIEN